MPHPQMFDDDDPMLRHVRQVALGFPDAAEKVSHGRPAFHTTKVFAYYGGSVKVSGLYRRHEQSLLVLLDEEDRLALVEDERCYVPAYLGPSGWIGLDLDESTDWGEVMELVDESYRLTAGPRRVVRLDAEERVVSAHAEIAAGSEQIFELIADPSRQPGWDGNANLAEAAAGQRVRAVGDVFTMSLTSDKVRENHVVEFEEGRLIAWNPAEPGQPPPGHLWRWELEPIDEANTRVTHTYDWTRLTDPNRLERARGTSSASLRSSLDRLAALAQGS